MSIVPNFFLAIDNKASLICSIFPVVTFNDIYVIDEKRHDDNLRFSRVDDIYDTSYMWEISEVYP